MNLHDHLKLILDNGQEHILHQLVLLEIGAHLMQVMPDFALSHFAYIADRLNVDLPDAKVRPRLLCTSSEAIGMIAAATWGDPPAERREWKLRLNDPALRSPSVEDQARILVHVQRLPFVVRAQWDDLT
jgi:hypothetical protein